jgi:hypothetical protein
MSQMNPIHNFAPLVSVLILTYHLKEIDHLGDLGVDWMLFKLILKK